LLDNTFEKIIKGNKFGSCFGMRNQSLKQKIFELIDLKNVGSYWDYKQYHSTEHNHKLLYAIICLY